MTILITKILSKTPFSILYLFSDLLFFLLYHVIKYRRVLVDDNLKHAFPEKSNAERKQIAKKSYKHLCDLIVESIKILTPKQLEKRFVIENPKILEKLDQSKQDFVLMTGHYGNWEWCQFNQIIKQTIPYFIYQSIRNPYANKTIKYLREQRGNKLILRKQILRVILSRKKNQIYSCYGFISDQSPRKDHSYWINFMNRETPIYTEVEKVAKKANLAVIIILIKKQQRGHYKTYLELITKNPNQHLDYEITDLFFKKLEEQIRLEPEYYLWTHNRWKHKRDKA